jgi:hypothetical protein
MDLNKAKNVQKTRGLRGDRERQREAERERDRKTERGRRVSGDERKSSSGRRGRRDDVSEELPQNIFSNFLFIQKVSPDNVERIWLEILFEDHPVTRSFFG